MVQFKTRLMKVASYFSSYKWPYCVERRSKLLYDFWQFFQQLFGIPVSNFTVFCEHNRDRVIGDSLWQPGKGVLRSIIVCTGRILFGREKRISREHASERRSREGASLARSRLARLSSLVQIGELARRLQRGTFTDFSIWEGWNFTNWRIWKDREICHSPLFKKSFWLSILKGVFMAPK